MSTHWERAARLRLPSNPDPPSMSAAGRGRGRWRCGQGGGRAPRGAMLSVAESRVEDAPVFSLCVNTLVCPCDESLGMSSAKSTPPHPFPLHGIIRELIVIFYCNLSNRGPLRLDGQGHRLLGDFQNVITGSEGPGSLVAFMMKTLYDELQIIIPENWSK